MKKVAFIALAAIAMAPISANAGSFIVDANANTAGGNVGVQSLALTAGQGFSVSVSADQLWAAGVVPRWSNADGLMRELFATGSDLSLLSAGTLIGQDWGLYGQDDFLAPYGTLVGRIGSTYYKLGTSFSGVAASDGVLELFYWDFNGGDNIGSINVAAVAAIPEPSTWAMMLAGFALAGVGLRRRLRAVVPQLV